MRNEKVYAFTQDTVNKLRMLTQADGRPIMEPAAAEGQHDRVMGVPYEIAE